LASKKNQVSGNTSGGDSEYSSSCGIHISDNPGVFVCDNTVDAIKKGLHFEGNDDLSTVSLSHINSHSFGLQINDRVGPQFKTGNQWLGAYYDIAAAELFGDVNFSLFTVESTSFVDFPSPLLFQNSDHWFETGGGNTQHCVPLPVSEKEEISPFEEALIKGNLDNSLTKAQLWDAQRLLIIRLLENPNWVNQNSELSAFLSQYLGSSVYQFSLLDKLISEYSVLSEQELNTLSDLEAKIAEKQLLLESLVQSEYNESNMLAILDTEEKLKNDSEEYDLASTAIKGEHVALFENLVSQVNELPHTSLFEANKRLILLWQLKNLLNEALTIEEVQQAKLMAQQCIAEGGYATKEAISWLPEEERPQFLTDNPQPCNQISPRSSKLNVVSTLSILPNPASDGIEVAYKSEKSARWSITTISGQVILTGVLTDGNDKLNIRTGNLKEGVYALRIEDENGDVKLSRFTIIH
jgi:hypothetical protein